MLRCLVWDIGWHSKNYDAFYLGCKKMGIYYEKTNNREKLKEYWDLVWIPSEYIRPEEIPLAKKIMYGPYNFVFPEGPWLHDRPFNDPRCFYNTLSTWIYNLYAEFGEMILEKKSLPFGVDIDKFSKKEGNNYKYDCFVYFKARHASHLTHVTDILDRLQLKYTILSYHTRYTEEHYLHVLNTSKFGIWIGSHESQGFAFQEALSTNTPLLVWDATSMFDEYYGDNQTYASHTDKKLLATSTTTWSDECGIKFTKKDDFENLLNIMLHIWNTFHPRKIIVEQLEPAVCLKRMLDMTG